MYTPFHDPKESKRSFIIHLANPRRLVNGNRDGSTGCLPCSPRPPRGLARGTGPFLRSATMLNFTVCPYD